MSGLPKVVSHPEDSFCGDSGEVFVVDIVFLTCGGEKCFRGAYLHYE